MEGPPVVVCAGPGGSGKSSVGAALATRLGWAVIDQDSATNPLMAEVAAAAGVPFDLDHPRLRGAVRQARYACLTAIARENAALGVPTILVAPFTAELTDRTAYDGLVSALRPGTLHLVLVDTPAGVRAARSAARGEARDLTPDRPVPLAEPAPSPSSPVPTLVVSGLATPAQIASSIIEALRLGEVLPPGLSDDKE